jgi:hypothetical protein
MSHFSKAEGITLVNDFTIEHANNVNGGRPFMSTCVPQSVDLDLHDLRVSHMAEFSEKVKDPKDPNFKLRTLIRARATMRDEITVFKVPDGEVGRFREIAEVIIKALPKGHVGGKHRASTYDGIGYSGMSSKAVPELGLMEEEPGVLLYFDPTSDSWPSEFKDPYLCIEAYIDEVEFNALIQRLSMTAAPVLKAELRLLIELFQNEVDASLSEPWHRQDYGMLMRGSKQDIGKARARVEMLQVTYQPNSVPPKPAATIDEDGTYQQAVPFEPVNAVTVRKIEKRLKDIAAVVAVGLTAIFIVLISR